MANNCYYEMSVVGTKENIERLHRIMKYEDPNLYIYRVFDAEMDEPNQLDNGRYMAFIYGDVAWGISPWLEDIPKVEKSYDGKKDNRLYVSLRFLSDLLHLDMEIQSEEPGCAFQQHCAIIDGEVVLYEDCSWFDLYYEREDFEDTSELIKDINEIIMEYPDIKEAFSKKDSHKEMVDEIYEVFNKYNHLSIQLGGYTDYTVYNGDICDGNISSWKINPYYIVD